MEDNNEKGFTVKDKRSFTQEGDIKKDEPSSPSDQESPVQHADTGADSTESTAAEDGDARSDTPSSAEPHSDQPFPEINFSSFVISLSSSALFHFGEIPDPVTNTKQRNLPLAKQTIDILGILKDKTEGNLSEEESKLLENLLFDLRLRYVNESKK